MHRTELYDYMMQYCTPLTSTVRLETGVTTSTLRLFLEP